MFMNSTEKDKKMEVEIKNTKYILEKNYRDCFDVDEFIDMYTEYFMPFDYIFGDYSYDKLRLKGFYNSDSIDFNDYNDINGLDDYINNYCAYGAKYFLLKKVK